MPRTNYFVIGFKDGACTGDVSGPYHDYDDALDALDAGPDRILTVQIHL